MAAACVAGVGLLELLLIVLVIVAIVVVARRL
jgi:hypothetical protein